MTDIPAYPLPGPADYLDDRYEWVEVRTFGSPPMFIRGACKHTDIVPVTIRTGEVVASLCVTCDTQFPGGRA